MKAINLEEKHMFTNEYSYSKDISKEVQLAFWNHRKGSGFFKIIMVLVIIIEIISIALIKWSNSNDNRIYFLVGATLLALMILPVRNYNNIRVSDKRMQAIYHGKDPILNYEISDQIIAHNLLTGASNIYEYSQILKVIESKNLIVLIIRGNLLLALNKNSFSQGSWEECKTFIKQKCKACKNNKESNIEVITFRSIFSSSCRVLSI